jgi:hypothetical protein
VLFFDKAHLFLTADNTITISAVSRADDYKGRWSACHDSPLRSALHFFRTLHLNPTSAPTKTHLKKNDRNTYSRFYFFLPLSKVRISTSSPVSRLTAWIDLAAALTPLKSIQCLVERQSNIDIFPPACQGQCADVFGTVTVSVMHM